MSPKGRRPPGPAVSSTKLFCCREWGTLEGRTRLVGLPLLVVVMAVVVVVVELVVVEGVEVLAGLGLL